MLKFFYKNIYFSTHILLIYLDANWDVKVDLFFWKDVEEIQNEDAERLEDEKVFIKNL